MPFDKAAPDHGLLHCRTVCRSSVRFLSEKTQMWQHGTEPILPMLNPFISSRLDRQSCGSIPCDQSRNVAESKGVKNLNRLQPSTTVFFPSVWFSLIQSLMIQSHDVPCNSQAGHMSGYSFERARRARSASVEIAPQQNALPDFSQIRPRPGLGNACLSCASSFLLMILQTFVNVLVPSCSNIIFTSKSPPSGKSQKVLQGTPHTKTARWQQAGDITIDNSSSSCSAGLQLPR